MNPAMINMWFTYGRSLIRQLGPYAAIALLLPGGSIVALLLWLYRQRAGYVLRK